MDDILYDIFSTSPIYTVGNKPRLELYRKPKFPNLSGNALELSEDSDSKSITGKIRVFDQQNLMRGTKINGKWTVDISFTAMGDRGPIILFLHGVPSNKASYYQMMNLLKPFCRCVAIDMLGMGDSQVNRTEVYNRYKKYGKDWPYKCWLWEHDSDYIYNFMKTIYPGEKFIFFADDWGGGSATHYAAIYPDSISHLILLDPVALDGYPVNEIQAIGRASALSDSMYQQAMGGFDQVVIQIYKTMVHKPDNVINQYTYRWIQDTYVNVDYSKKYSSNMSLKWNALRNLSDRSYTLGGPQLLPFHKIKNPGGVKYSKIKAQVLILWGAMDNMMPEAQRHRLRAIMTLATQGRVRVQTRQIPKAGHFAAWDNPDLVAADTLDYILEQFGPGVIGDPFFGFMETKIWKGDEKFVIENLRKYPVFRIGGGTNNISKGSISRTGGKNPANTPIPRTAGTVSDILTQLSLKNDESQDLATLDQKLEIEDEGTSLIAKIPRDSEQYTKILDILNLSKKANLTSGDAEYYISIIDDYNEALL